MTDTSHVPWRPLGEVIVERGLITADELEDALEEQVRTGRRLGSILIARGLVAEQDLATALVDQIGIGDFIDELEQAERATEWRSRPFLRVVPALGRAFLHVFRIRTPERAAEQDEPDETPPSGLASVERYVAAVDDHQPGATHEPATDAQEATDEPEAGSAPEAQAEASAELEPDAEATEVEADVPEAGPETPAAASGLEQGAFVSPAEQLTEALEPAAEQTASGQTAWDAFWPGATNEPSAETDGPSTAEAEEPSTHLDEWPPAPGHAGPAPEPEHRHAAGEHDAPTPTEQGPGPEPEPRQELDAPGDAFVPPSRGWLERLRGALVDAEAELDRVAEQASSTASALEKANRRLAEREQALAAELAQRAKLEDELTRAVAQLHERESLLGGLESTVAELNGLLEAAQRELEQAQAEGGRVAGELEEATRRQAEAAARLAEVESRCADHEERARKLVELAGRAARLSDRLAEANEAREAAERRLERAAKALEDREANALLRRQQPAGERPPGRFDDDAAARPVLVLPDVRALRARVAAGETNGGAREEFTTTAAGDGHALARGRRGDAAPTGHLLFVPGADAGHELVERGGEAPAPGTAVEIRGRRFSVARVGRSPIPFDRRPCVHLLASE